MKIRQIETDWISMPFDEIFSMFYIFLKPEFRSFVREFFRATHWDNLVLAPCAPDHDAVWSPPRLRRHRWSRIEAVSSSSCAFSRRHLAVQQLQTFSRWLDKYNAMGEHELQAF